MLIESPAADVECRKLLDQMKSGDLSRVEYILAKIEGRYHYAGAVPSWGVFCNLTHCFRALLTDHLLRTSETAAETIDLPRGHFPSLTAIEDAADYDPSEGREDMEALIETNGDPSVGISGHTITIDGLPEFDDRREDMLSERDMLRLKLAELFGELLDDGVPRITFSDECPECRHYDGTHATGCPGRIEGE